MQQLLRTKFFIPQIPPEIVPRPQLIQRLHAGLRGKLSLIVAPAGYGKTTLTTTWLQQLNETNPERQIVWVSLAPNDNGLQRFFTYFVGALTQLDGRFATISDSFLQNSSGEVAVEPLLTSLLNQLISYGRPVLLVLDDYHEITEPAIHEAVSFWLDNQPPDFHLAITSRSEPPLPLPRMRVRRQVTDIDARALRFSRGEAADFLNDHMHLNLSAEAIDQLDTVTEGWVASLQLAALSLQTAADPTEFIQTFSGDDRYIVDYLVNEVLERQPEPIRHFLLHTSVLERFNVSLCNAVTNQDASQQILDTLDQSRLFLIPLDNGRHWYRYHHLFAECLQAELGRIAPDAYQQNHERASDWFAANDFFHEAIEHAFAAENHALAADLLGKNARTKLLSYQGNPQQLWNWLQQLPAELVQVSPRLLIASAWLEFEIYSTDSTRLDDRLEKAAALIHHSEATYTPAEIAIMETEIALTRVVLYRMRGDVTAAIAQGERALTLIADQDAPILQRGARGSLAIALFWAGDITRFLALSRSQIASIEQAQEMNYARYVFLAYAVDAARLAGQLDDVERIMNKLGSAWWPQLNSGAAMLAVSWAAVLYERNQLDEAAAFVKPAIDQLRPIPSMDTVVQIGQIVLVKIRQAQNKPQDALAILPHRTPTDPAAAIHHPFVRVSATTALINLRQGNLAAAQSWVAQSGLTAADPPTYQLEIDYLVLTRVLIASGKPDEAQPLLARLAEAAARSGRTAHLIEVTILQALLLYIKADTKQALSLFQKALRLAEPLNYVRLFVDEGETMVSLLEEAVRQKVNITFARQLLSLFGRTIEPSPQSAVPSPTQVEPSPPLLNPLTERELATLRYLATDLTIPEIAEQMIVAPSTVRTYVKRLYGKLDAHSRIEAVNRGRSLNLI